jgi:F-type H+-transporting ATPase subunit b
MIIPHATVLADLPLGLNPLLFLAQLVNFGILYYILNRFAFPALRKTLDARTATIREGIANAEEAKQSLARANEQAQGIIQQAQQRGQQIIADATTNGERLRVQFENEAKARAVEVAEQNRRRMAQEEAQARNALRQQVADLAISAAGRVVGESLDGPRQRRLVDEFIAEVE